MILAETLARIADVKAANDTPTAAEDDEDEDDDDPRRLKKKHSAAQVEKIAKRIGDIAARIQSFADAMRSGEGPPEFEFMKKTPMNKFVVGLEDWVDGLDALWGIQLRRYHQSRGKAKAIESRKATKGKSDAPPPKR